MRLRSYRRALSLTTLGILAAAMSMAVLLFADAGSAAGARAPTAVATRLFVYSAQFNCGIIPQDSVPLDPLNAPREFPRELPAKPANYATDINVHNPQSSTASFTKKAVLSGWVGTLAGTTVVTTSEPEAQFQGGHLIPVKLAPDGAFEIDCADITKVLAPPGFSPMMTFIKGFVVIQSRVELDVAASYTSERVGATTIHCLLSDGTVTDATATATGTTCPKASAAGNVTTIGIAADNTGTGLTLDVEYITPKIVVLTPNH